MFGRLGKALGRTDEPDVPVKPPPGDCKARLDELSNFFALLDTVEAFRKAMSDAIRALEAAPGPVLSQLQKCYPDGSPGKGLVSELAECVGPCVEQMHLGQQRLDVLQEVCMRRRLDITTVNEMLAARSERWTTKVHCDEKADELRRRFCPSYSLEEKRSRLSAQHKAEEAFSRSTQDVNEAIDALLVGKQEATSEMLAEVRHCYSALWSGATRWPSPRSPAAADSGKATARPVELDAPGGLPCLLTSTSVESGGGPAVPPAKVFAASAAPGPEAAQQTEPLTFAKGERVQVWSTTDKAWLEGVVDDIFEEATTDGGFAVPAGVIKVSHASGKKYVRPERVKGTLRKWS